MYNKVKNTLVGLGIVAAFIAGGVLFSEPTPAQTAQPTRSTEAQQAAMALAVVQAAISLAQAQVSAEVAADAARAAQPEDDDSASKIRAKTSSRLRLELGLPYYSFGAMLPRRRES